VDLEKFHKQYGFKICPSLTKDQRHELLKTLYAYKNVFVRDVTEIKACNGPPLKIDLHRNRKMFKRQFKLNEADKADLTRQISDMQKADVIESSDDPDYNSPAFLVTKKNGQKRLVIDLRGINSLIRPKSVQLPKIDDLLQDITSKRPMFLTTINISSAFWQIRVDNESRKYASFTGPDGRRWQFKRCPFGLSTSPNQLVLILTSLFSDRSRFNNLSFYMDDIIIASNSWNSHLQQLELTLQTLQKANITCNPRKKEIGFPGIDYLGFRVSRNSLRLSEKRIQIIHQITAPKNVKALQRILGMINYWRRYIPFLAKHTTNMRKLLQKDTPFKWTAECEIELDYIKKTLVSDPILKPIDPTRYFNQYRWQHIRIGVVSNAN